MNKLTWITNTLACLMIVLTALGAVCGAAVTMAADEEFYGGMSRTAVQDTLDLGDLVDITKPMTDYIGLSLDEHYAFAEEMAAFMRGETDVQPEVLNEKEQLHMLDVRRLVRLAQTVSKGCMTVAAGMVMVIAWIRAMEKKKSMPFGVVIGALILAGAMVGVHMLLNTQGFEALFIRFHELFFTNDLWLMNPETDILIRMMPQLLFERAGMELVRMALQSFMITWMLLLAVYGLVNSMIRRQLTHKNQ